MWTRNNVTGLYTGRSAVGWAGSFNSGKNHGFGPSDLHFGKNSYVQQWGSPKP